MRLLAAGQHADRQDNVQLATQQMHHHLLVALIDLVAVTVAQQAAGLQRIGHFAVAVLRIDDLIRRHIHADIGLGERRGIIIARRLRVGAIHLRGQLIPQRDIGLFRNAQIKA